MITVHSHRSQPIATTGVAGIMSYFAAHTRPQYRQHQLRNHRNRPYHPTTDIRAKWYNDGSGRVVRARGGGAVGTAAAGSPEASPSLSAAPPAAARGPPAGVLLQLQPTGRGPRQGRGGGASGEWGFFLEALLKFAHLGGSHHTASFHSIPCKA